MQLDQNMLSRLLSMNDRQLGEFIGAIAAEAGIDPKTLGLGPEALGAIRGALGNANEGDLEQLRALYESHKKGLGG